MLGVGALLLVIAATIFFTGEIPARGDPNGHLSGGLAALMLAAGVLGALLFLIDLPLVVIDGWRALKFRRIFGLWPSDQRVEQDVMWGLVRAELTRRAIRMQDVCNFERRIQTGISGFNDGIRDEVVTLEWTKQRLGILSDLQDDLAHASSP